MIDPLTNLPYSQDNVIDPATNESYLQEAQQYGSVQAAEASVGAFGGTVSSGSGFPVQPASPGLDGSTQAAPGSQGSTNYTDDEAWAQAATAGLASIGYSSTDVATALGAYLAGEQLTTAQAQLVHTALAEYPIPQKLPVLVAPVTGDFHGIEYAVCVERSCGQFRFE
jgi:hypothetical protein